MSDHALEMQYVDLAHQSEKAELGMWGFIATEVLFLGGSLVFFATCIRRGWPPR